MKNIDEISSEVKALASRAKAGKLQLHEFQGGSFTYVLRIFVLNAILIIYKIISTMYLRFQNIQLRHVRNL